MSKAQKARERQVKIANAVFDELHGEIICNRCGAHVETYADKCKAALDRRCEGFDRYDEVRRKYEKEFAP